MPAFWLVIINIPGLGILLGVAAMYALSRVVDMEPAGFVAGALGLFLAVEMAALWLQRRGMGPPTAHTPVDREGRVVRADAGVDTAFRGRVCVDGIHWLARSHQRLREGQRVRVLERTGLTLTVSAMEPD